MPAGWPPRLALLAGGVVATFALAACALMVMQPQWQFQRDAMSPRDIAFTWVALLYLAAGVMVGLLGQARAGWIGAGAGLVGGSVVSAVLWGEPSLLQPTLLIIELAPLTLGYALGYLVVDPGRRLQLIYVCGIGLWLPFAALTALSLLVSLSRPGLGDHDWPRAAVAALVSGAIPFGLVSIRSEGTRLLGRLVLVFTGWGVAVWALLDGGNGRRLWDAEVSPPLIAVMLTGVIIGLLLGLAAVLYRVETGATPGGPAR